MSVRDITDELRSLSESERRNYKDRLNARGSSILYFKAMRNNRTRHINHPFPQLIGRSFAYTDLDELAIYIAQSLPDCQNRKLRRYAAKALGDVLPRICYERLYVAMELPPQSRLLYEGVSKQLKIPDRKVSATYMKKLRNVLVLGDYSTDRWKVDDTFVNLLHIFEEKNYIDLKVEHLSK